jgi:hypothetical protein
VSIMSIITSGRRMVAKTFLDSVWIHRRTVISDGSGGSTESWVRDVMATPGRFGPLNDYDLSATANTTFGAASAAVSMPHTTLVAEGDRLEHGTDGSLWLVVGVLTPPGTLNTAMRVLVREA